MQVLTREHFGRVITIGRGASEHTDVTNVYSQRRMQQNRVETRCTLYNRGHLSRHQDERSSDQTDPKCGLQRLGEVVADGLMQCGYRCSEKIPADERDMKQIVLFQMRKDELEDIEVEIVSRDHEL